MKAYRMNPDREYVNKIIDGIMRKDGHCPCRVLTNDETLCPCDEFIKKGECKCRLFIKIEEEKAVIDDGIKKDSV